MGCGVEYLGGYFISIHCFALHCSYLWGGTECVVLDLPRWVNPGELIYTLRYSKI